MNREIEEIENLLVHSTNDTTTAAELLVIVRRHLTTLRNSLQETENARVNAENGRRQAQNALQEMHTSYLRQIEQKNVVITELENSVQRLERQKSDLEKLLKDAECKNEQLIRRIAEEIGKKLCEDMKKNLEKELNNLKKNMDYFNELNKEITLAKKALECKSKQLEELEKQLSAIMDLNKTKKELHDKNILISELEIDRTHYKSRLEASKEDLNNMSLRLKELISNNKLLAEETKSNINSVLNYMKLTNQNLLTENAKILNNITYSNENLKFNMQQLNYETLIYTRNSLDAFFHNESFMFIANFLKLIQRHFFKPFIFVFVLFAAFIAFFSLRHWLFFGCEEF